MFSKLKLHFCIILSFFSAKYLKYVTGRKPYMQSNEQQRLLQQFYDDLDDDTFIWIYLKGKMVYGIVDNPQRKQ